MQLSLFDTVKAEIILEEPFEAYFNYRSNKRNTANVIAFKYVINIIKLDLQSFL
jgi:hypothetical protein